MALYKRRILLLATSIVFVFLAIPTLFYAQGYRLSNGLKLSGTGGLYVASPLGGAKIYINNKLKRETSVFQRGFFVQNLVPASYSVLIAKDGYWPWQKNLKVSEHYVAEAKAFFVPREPRGDVLYDGSDGPVVGLFASPDGKILLLVRASGAKEHIQFYRPSERAFFEPADNTTSNLLVSRKTVVVQNWEYNQVLFRNGNNTIRATFADNTVRAAIVTTPPGQQTSGHIEERFASHDRLHLWLDDAAPAIWIEWLDDVSTLPYFLQEHKELVFQSRFPIRGIDFFPRRPDVIVMAVSNGIFALEIDDRSGNRMMQPIYKGKEPIFALAGSEEAVYVVDNGALMKIELLL